MADRTEALVLQMSADIRRLEKAMDQARGVTNRQLGAIEKRFDQANAHVKRSGDKMASDLRAGIAALAVGAAVTSVTKYADAWTEAGNKIAAAGVEASNVGATLQKLSDISLKTSSNFEATVDLYARMTRATKELGLSQRELLEATEIANKAFKAGGASATEQASAVMQLGQALGSGVLSGDELRSIRENAPILAKAIANEFGQTMAGLKKLGEQGKLTSDKVFAAILHASEDVEKQYKSMSTTVADSFTNLQTAATRYLGEADKASGATKTLSGFIQAIANDFDRFAEAAIVAAQVLGGVLAAGAILKVILALRTMTAGMTAAAVAARALGVAMTLALGPWGLVIAAITAAIIVFNLELARSSEQASEHELAVDRLNRAVDEHTAALGRQAIARGKDQKLAEAAVATTKLEVEEQLRLNQALLEKAEALQAVRTEMALQAGLGGGEFIAPSEVPELTELRKAVRTGEAALADQQSAQKLLGMAADFIRKKADELGISKLFEPFDEEVTPKLDPNAMTLKDAEKLAGGEFAIRRQLQEDYDKFTEAIALAQKAGNLQLAEQLANDRFMAAVEAQEKIDELTQVKLEMPDADKLVSDTLDVLPDVVEAGKELREAMREATKEGIRDGIATGDWGDVLSGIIADAIVAGMDDSINKLADLITNALLGADGQTGWLQHAFNAIGSAFAPGRAGGGAVYGGQSYRVNEGSGGEWLHMQPGTRGQVFTASQMNSMAAGKSGGGATIDNRLIVQGSIDAVTWPKVQAELRARDIALRSVFPAAVNATLVDNRRQKRRL